MTYTVTKEVVDAFYVREESGGKVSSERRRAVEAAVLEALRPVR